MKRLFTLLAVCFLAGTLVFQSACTPPTRVADILASPAAYENKEVVIKGVVTGNFWFRSLTTGLYRVLDDGSSIWVVTKLAPPAEGTEVTVKGTVASAIVIADQSLGTHIQEISRK